MLAYRSIQKFIVFIFEFYKYLLTTTYIKIVVKFSNIFRIFSIFEVWWYLYWWKPFDHKGLKTR